MGLVEGWPYRFFVIFRMIDLIAYTRYLQTPKSKPAILALILICLILAAFSGRPVRAFCEWTRACAAPFRVCPAGHLFVQPSSQPPLAYPHIHSPTQKWKLWPECRPVTQFTTQSCLSYILRIILPFEKTIRRGKVSSICYHGLTPCSPVLKLFRP